MKIYVDAWYTTTISQPHVEYTSIDEIPNDCDVIAISFYNNHYDQYTETIRYLRTKCQHLIVNISEPTGHNLQDFLQNNADPCVHFFGDAVLNFSVANWQTIVSWFIEPDNFYASRPWAKDLLTKLVPWQQRHPTYKFDALLGGQRDHRDLIDRLYKSSLRQDQILYRYFKDYNNHDGMYLPAGIGAVDEYHNTTYQGYNVNIAAMVPVEIYNDSWYSVVAETTAFNSHNQYTEKVAKPMLGQRPFVAFAGQHYLRNLQSLGFKTFADVIDESYDGIANPVERMHQAWRQVEWLCDQDPHQVHATLASVLEHNRQHFIETDWLMPVKHCLNALSATSQS